MGLLACSVLNICANLFCVCYCRCHLLHLQPLCLFLPGHGPVYLFLRPPRGLSAPPLDRSGRARSVRDARHGGGRIGAQQRRRRSEPHRRRRRDWRAVGAGCAAASEHAVKAEARVEHIATTRRSVRRQPNVVPRGTRRRRGGVSGLRAQQQHVGRRLRVQLQHYQLRLVQRQHGSATQIQETDPSPATRPQADPSGGQHGRV